MIRVSSLLLLGALLSCAHFPPPMRASGTIRGLVLTEPDLQPMGGATVTLAQRRGSATTAPDGTFQFTNVPVGVHTLSVRVGSGGDGTMPGVSVTGGDSTCVLAFVSPPLPGNSSVSHIITGPVTDPLLVLNGVVRFYSTDSSATAAPAQPARVIQIRNPWGHVNITSVQSMRADSAMQLYGRRASLGALIINTRPQAPCSQ